MELRRIIILFSTFAASITRRIAENVSNEASCMSPCAGSSALTLPPGFKFSYRYSTSTNTFLQGQSSKRSGISLESTAIIEVLSKCHSVLKLRDVQIKMILDSREKMLKENSNLREALEQHLLLFCFRNGKIQKIFPQEGEPTWALNIKRGILSVFQTSWVAAAANSSVEEVDILGKCPTKYQQKGSLLLKTKDLNLCSHRFSAFTSLRSVALPNAPSEELFLSSKLECAQQFEERILIEAKCSESHLVTPPARQSGGAKTQTHTAMKLLHTETGVTTHERMDTKDIYESTLLYEKEKVVLLSKEEEEKVVVNILLELCVKPNVDYKSAVDHFMTLVFELRHLSASALMSLWQRSSSKCQGKWHPLLDALPACKTEACVALMKELIVSEEVEEDKIESFLWSLAFIPEPTTGMIDALAPLLQLPRGRQSAFLGISALVNHFCSMRNDCDKEPEVQAIVKILEGHLGKNCVLHESEGTGQMELTLKAIGNAGLAVAALEPVLSSCAMLKSNPAEIRLAAIEAYRRIPCTVNRDVLAHLYQTYDEDVEIRIASYLMSTKCPSEELFNQVKWTLQQEKSSQVGAFIWSHLSELLETEDPLKQHLKNFLPDDILNKEFDWETGKFSSYSDVTFQSAAVRANAEANLIFSPASFLPRSIATNLTVHLFGRAVNLLEVGIRLENMEDVVEKFFGLHPVQNTMPESPAKTAHQAHPNKPMSKSSSFINNLPLKKRKSSLRNEKQSCPDGQNNKMSELVKKFTKARGKKKKKPKCGLSIKVFGNELAVVDCGHLRSQVKHHYLNLAELMVKLLKGEEVQFNKRLSWATEELWFPAISGLPVLLALNASAALNVTIKGNMDFKQRNNFFINGYIKPSALFQVSAQMGTVGTLGKSSLNWLTELRSLTSLDGGIQVKKGKEVQVFLNTPEESMEIVYFSSKLYITTMNDMETLHSFPGHIGSKSCTNEQASKAFGWQLCSEFSKPQNQNSGFIFPFSGPVKATVTLKKQDRSLRQYLMTAAYNYIYQKGSWIPNEVTLHFYMGTPKSELKRDIAIDFHFNIPQKKFRIQIIQPKKKMQVNGKIEVSRNSRFGHLELILDDYNIYYIKGRTDLQSVAGEQRYTTHLEAKLLKHGSPIILSGNITKHPGKKMAFSVSLVNLLKEAAFLAVCLEKKADDKLKQYSMEGEMYIPGVLGSHIAALLQQRGHFWSNALRIKYGLFGDAKKLQYECNTSQKLKMETSPQDVFQLDLDHELHCTQILAYNHKVHLHHEETVSQLHSQLEVNYGKHWDEINNKKRVIINQVFKNNSYPSLTSYFIEFIIQVPEKQVDYRTQLQHSHTTQGYAESSTHFKVHYNNHMPFVAGLQWKDMSRHSLKRWEGTFNMDTPWLYLYAAHKLQQLHRSTYLATVELTAGKAFNVKGLVIEVFCKDKDDEKEGRIRIQTPTVTYLRASTVNHFKKGFLHSQSEVVSVWHQLLKNEILFENNEQTKVLHFQIKLAKQEFNVTATYLHLDVPRKTNFSAWILWADHKNLPLVLQFEAEIEEVKKEKLLYQKHGTVLLRHPFKLPIPQSFLLQETFTVNKKEKHYFLETKVLINELYESVQTLTLGYQVENPYVCAGLTHPYNGKILPRNIEVCARTRNLTHARSEVEVNLNVDKKEVLSFQAQHHNKSSMDYSKHLLQMNMTHSFQLKFPQSISMNGELFSKESKLAGFTRGLMIKATVNQLEISQFSMWLNGSDTGFGIYSQLLHLNHSNFLPCFQAHVTTNKYGVKSLNGSFYLRSSGKDLVLLEADFNNEIRKTTKASRVNAFLRQAIVTQFRDLWLNFMGKMSPSRFMMSSEMKLNQNTFHISIIGSKEQKAGLVLTLHGRIQHNLHNLESIIPQDLSMGASLKWKKNIHEGIVSLTVNHSMFEVYIRNRNVFGNGCIQNILLAVTQNGSRTFPVEIKLKGQLDLQRGIQRAMASIQMDTGTFCIDITNIIIQEQMEITGTLMHNITSLYKAGLATEIGITAIYGHIDTNYTITLTFQGSNRRITATFGAEMPLLESLQVQLAGSVSHNISELTQWGIPSTLGCSCYYENFSKRFAVGMTLHTGEKKFGIEVENQGTTTSAAGFSLFLHHDVGLLLHILPSVVRVRCHGDATFSHLSGHCSGEVSNHSFEKPAQILLNGSVLASKCAADQMGEVVSNDTFAQFHTHTTCSPPEHIVEINFQHIWPYLRSLGLAEQNQIRVTTVKQDGYRGLLEVTFGECMLTGNGELTANVGVTAAKWRMTLLNKCDMLEKMELPPNLVARGSFLKNMDNISLTTFLQCNDKTADMKLEMSSIDKYTIQGTLNHSLPDLLDLGLPPENLVLLSVTNAFKGQLLLHAGNCKLKAQGEIQPQNRTDWTLEVETDCKALQDLGIPVRIDGTGHILINKMNLDSQIMLTLDENTLHGLLILQVMDARQELRALLTQNIKGSLHLGIPTRTKVDLISEKNGAVYTRLLQFNVDGKQITEELSFTQKADHVFLDYKLRHNLTALQTLWIQDKIGLQVAVSLLDVKNATVKVLYGSDWMIVGGLMQKTTGRLDLAVNLHHHWSSMLQTYIPEATKVMMSFESNAIQERGMQTVRAQTLIMYTLDSVDVDQQHENFCCSLHNDIAVVMASYPNAISLSFSLQKLENKTKLAFQVQHNNRSLNGTIDVFTSFEMYGPFELRAEAMHSLTDLKHLGFPSSFKLILLEIISENKTEASLKLTGDPNLNLWFLFTIKNKWQSDEIQIKSLQNLPFLLQYFPSMAEVSSKVNYATKEAEGKLSTQMENKDFLVLTKLSFKGTNHTYMLQLIHTIPQLTVLPRQLVLTTAYQKRKKTQGLQCTALWDGKEMKVTGSYSGLFPKMTGGHGLKVEICHPFSIPFPHHSTLNVYVEHSTRSHKDDIIIGWDTKDQVFVSSLLKLGKEHVSYNAAIAHPFNLALKHAEVSSLTDNRRESYKQQIQLAWNDGEPGHMKFTFGDKSKANATLWDVSVTASSGQLQNILGVMSFQACGFLQQTAALFNQHLDLKWDGKKVMQNLTYEKNKPLHLDKIQIETILENVLLTSCSSQHFLGKVETDYSAQLNYYMSLGVCGLPNAIALSGNHQLNKGDLLLQSEGQVSLAGDEGSITVVLRNHSQAKVKNYSTELSLKSTEAVWLDMMGRVTASDDESKILLEGQIDSKEKVKIAASRGKGCLQYYVGYLKGSSEDGLELTACADSQKYAALDAHLVLNGEKHEELGHLSMEASNHSLSLKAYGCRNPVMKAESKLNEILSDLQHRLVAKIKNVEEQLWNFRKLVQRIEFLYDAVGWPLKTYQEVAGILQTTIRGVIQMWKQSGVKEIIQVDLPLYLGKLQDVVQQMQMELQKPLTTLKDAYYDVTLKPLDEVWQQKTEEYLKKLQAFVPTVVKDVWFMKPIQVSLRMLKTGLDVVMQQMLSWAEAKFSRAVSKLQKSLSNLYSFSSRNCSLTVRLPGMPKGQPTLYMTNLTNYLIEEKLMKPLHSLYNINLIMEYYKFKRTMMESPFEHHALLIGSKHLRTFDGRLYSLTSNCSVLLAQDFVQNAFTIVLNLNSGSGSSLYVHMDSTTILIYPKQKTYKKYNDSEPGESCQRFDIPLEENGNAVQRETDHVEMSTTRGALFSCDLRHDLCTLTLDGWHHGASAGLFGTNDNEAGNEWMLPVHSYKDSLQEFVHAWQVNDHCNQAKRINKPCFNTSSSRICKTFFQDYNSPFRNCFKVVDTEPFYNLCAIDMCELQDIKAACTLAAAFVHLCNRNFVPLEMPLQCDGELRLRDSKLHKPTQ